MTGLVWLLRLDSSRWWSGSGTRDVPAFGGTCAPGLEPGRFPTAVDNPLTRVSLQLRPESLGIFAGDPGSLEAEVAWGHGDGALQGDLMLLASRFFGRLDRSDTEALTGLVTVELEHHLAFAYRRPLQVWSDEAQRAETAGDAGLSQLPALARGDITGQWPPRA